jgi:hypothetical protein
MNFVMYLLLDDMEPVLVVSEGDGQLRVLRDT